MSQVTLCDPRQQVTSHSSEVDFSLRALLFLTLLNVTLLNVTYLL